MLSPSKKRKFGYYHVRFDYQWAVAFWSGKFWYRLGHRTSLLDKDFDEIDEDRIAQPEQIACNDISQEDRLVGHYYAKTDTGWEIAFWSGKTWHRIGYRKTCQSSFFNKIGSDIIPLPIFNSNPCIQA